MPRRLPSATRKPTCRCSGRPRAASPLPRFPAGDRRDCWAARFRVIAINGACSISYVRLSTADRAVTRSKGQTNPTATPCFWTCYELRTIPTFGRSSAPSSNAPLSGFSCDDGSRANWEIGGTLPATLRQWRKGTNLSGAMRQQGLWDGTYPGDQDGEKVHFVRDERNLRPAHPLRTRRVRRAANAVEAQ